MPTLRTAWIALLLATRLFANESPSFTREIAPLLRDQCLRCHSAEKARGGLKLINRDFLLSVVEPGKSAESTLFTFVRDGKMPPRNPLSSEQVELLRKWIDAGAVWEGPELKSTAAAEVARAGKDWWSLQPIRRPALPTLRDAGRVRTPIDAFLLAKLEEKGLTFAPEADRRTLIRRVTFDLIGLAPTFEEIEKFAADARPDAYERLVDRLLASPHHGERWGRHWLDLVRFAESHGYEMNTLRPNAWPYRDYVIRSFNHDLPYPQFVREQLAGDALGSNDYLSEAATGFLVAGPHDLVGNATVEGTLQQRADDLADVVATTGTTFLGLTVGCARCHDHKFDPISQKDFYAQQAVFAGVEHKERSLVMPQGSERQKRLLAARDRLRQLQERLDAHEPPANERQKRGPVNARRNVERFSPVEAKFVRFTILSTNDGTEPCIDELELYGPLSRENVALGGVKPSASSVYPNSDIHKLEHVNDGIVGNSRSWISAEPGKGWVQLELPETTTLNRIVWGRDREERYRDRLAREYRIEVSRDAADWQLVAGSEDRSNTAVELSSTLRDLMREEKQLQDELKQLSEPVKVYAGTFRSPDVVHRLRRGDVMQKLEEVEPGTIEAIRPTLSLQGDAKQRRIALADWLCSNENPLPARVMVNRVWQWHFGQGIVSTPSDFGFNGDRPSHPELLDWLAAEFQSSGGSIKQLHRRIVLSTAYRQSGRWNDRAAAVDAGNRLLWRFPPRRLEAEAIRDRLLQTTGELDRSMGGPGYHLWEYSGYVIVFAPKAKLGRSEFRRMVYQFKPRLQQDATFGAFDCPDATATQPRRNVSTTALQALNLLNDPFILDQAEYFAERLKREAAANVSEQVGKAFRLAFGRDPSDQERLSGIELVNKHGLTLLCRTLINANEFVFVP